MRCACGCKTEIDAGANGRRVYAPGHRQRGYRKRVKVAMEASGLPANPSMKAVKARRASTERNGDAQTAGKRAQNGRRRAARPSDVRPTFTRVYEVLVRELGSPLRARDLAEQMLTDKQRARVRELGL